MWNGLKVPEWCGKHSALRVCLLTTNPEANPEVHGKLIFVSLMKADLDDVLEFPRVDL